MSGSGFTNWQSLGIMPLQDHDQGVTLSHLRSQMVAGRIRRRPTPEEMADGGEQLTEYARDFGLGTLGDIHPWFFWQTLDRGRRGTGSWAQVYAAITVGGGDGGFKGGGTGRKPGPSSLLPIRYGQVSTDPRYREKFPGWPVCFPTLPQGTLMAVAPGTEESAQHEVMLHTDPRLMAPNIDGPGSAGTLVCDLQPNGQVCMDDSTEPGVGGRHARLQSMMRVIPLPETGIPLIGHARGNAIAWNLSLSGYDRLAGYGMCWSRMDQAQIGPKTPRRKGPTTGPRTRPRGPITGQPTAGQPPRGSGKPTSAAIQAGSESNGAGTDQPAQGQQGGSETRRTAQPADETVGQNICGFGRFRKSPRAGFGSAFMDRAVSGPFHPGHINDKHKVGEDEDGNPLNSGHLDTNAYFYRNQQEDGPLLFEGDYPNPPPMPLIAPVHLGWDPAPKHPWVGGARDGYWRWWCEVPYLAPPPTEPPITPPREPPTRTPSTPGTPTPSRPGTPTPITPRPGRPLTPGTTAPPVPGVRPGKGPITPPAGPGVPPRGGGWRTWRNPITGQPAPGTYNPDDRQIGGGGGTTLTPTPAEPGQLPGGGVRANPTTPRPEPRPPNTGKPPPPLDEGRQPWELRPNVPGDISHFGLHTGTQAFSPASDIWARQALGASGGPTATDLAKVDNGIRTYVGQTATGDVGLYSIHHPMMESFGALSFRPQVWQQDWPSFEHNPTVPLQMNYADERVRPQVLAARPWGAQANGDWDYAIRPEESRARGGTADGGLLFSPPEFEMEDYFSINARTDTDTAETHSYVTAAPGVSFALGKPELDGGLTPASVIIQQKGGANAPFSVLQLDSNRLEQKLYGAELDQGSSERVFEVAGEQAIRIPRGTGAQRPSAIAPAGGFLRINTDVVSSVDTVEFFDQQASVWKQLGTGVGGSSTFIGLTDTPGSYAGSGGYVVNVNAAANALEFTDAIVVSVGAGDAGKFVQLDGAGLLDTSVIPGGIGDHGSLSGLGDDDHTQYHNDARGDARYYQQTQFVTASAGAPDAGKPVELDGAGLLDASFFPQLDHGGLAGLGDDDHTQYHNDARGDARYYTQTQLDGGQLDGRYFTEAEHINSSSGAPDAGKPVVLDGGGLLDGSFIDQADIDHTAIQSVGVNTHAQLDTHVADTSIHYADIGGASDVDTTGVTDGDVLVFDGSEFVPVAAEDLAGVATLGNYDYRTSTTFPVASGDFAFNNADPELATEMNISHFNANGTNTEPFLNLADPGSVFYFQRKGSGANYLLVRTTTNTNNGTGTTTTFGLESVTVVGTNPSDNQRHIGFLVHYGVGVIDHGDLAGLGDDDHPQYLLADGSRAMSGALAMGSNKITGLTAGTAAGEAVEVLSAVTTFLAKAGDTMTGNLVLNDNVELRLGTGSDSRLSYDGANTIWNPAAVGSGFLRVNANIGVNINPTEDVHAGGVIRANGGFKVGGTLGLTDTVSFEDGSGQFHDVVINGGIIESWNIT